MIESGVEEELLGLTYALFLHIFQDLHYSFLDFSCYSLFPIA